MSDTIWTPAAIRMLLELREEGVAYRTIAGQLTARFGGRFTKNSCIGKAWSLQQPEKKHRPRPHKKRGTPMQKNVRVDAVIPPDLPQRQAGQPITIYQLRRNDCRWPFGGPMQRPPFLYCGCPAPEGEPYCAEHYARAHTVASPRRTA